jgi:hypothetical protein
MAASDMLPWRTGMVHVTITEAHPYHRPIG